MISPHLLSDQKKDGCTRNFKRPDAVRSFPEGCGRNASTTTNSKGNPDDSISSNPSKENLAMVNSSKSCPRPRISKEFHQESSLVYNKNQEVVPLLGVDVEGTKLSSCIGNEDYDDYRIGSNRGIEEFNFRKNTHPRTLNEYSRQSRRVYFKNKDSVVRSSAELDEVLASRMRNKDCHKGKAIKSREIQDYDYDRRCLSNNSGKFYGQSRNVYGQNRNTAPPTSVKLEKSAKNLGLPTSILNKNFGEEQTTKTLQIEGEVSKKCFIPRISKGYLPRPTNTKNYIHEDITPLQTIHAKRSKVVSLTAKNRYHDRKQVISTRDSSLSLDDRKVIKALDSFREIYTKIHEEHEKNAKARGGGFKIKVHMKAAMVLKQRFGWINTSKRIGHVPGIQIGDKFQWMTELNIIGLHRQFMNGIDYMVKDGKTLATSIVSTDRYYNLIKSSDTLIYMGQGGFRCKIIGGPDRDQKLERGNLALKNSMEARNPVRVIRGIKQRKLSFPLIEKNGLKLFNSYYVYDGLYYVDKFWQQKEESGKLVFKFCMKRIPGQPELASNWAKLDPIDKVIG